MYHVDPDGKGSFSVYCDMSSGGGGWTLLQRRLDDSLSFNNDWQSYKNGFGDLLVNFWLGNDNIHRLASLNMVLVVTVRDWSDNTANATYSEFGVSDELGNYTLTARRYSGSAGDSLSSHDGMKFTTRDEDNDEEAYSNCAVRFGGGWWYKGCVDGCNLNGNYIGNARQTDGVIWRGFTPGVWQSLKYSDMKIRPVAF
ncbi:predicted protein [Nematostella vectensis]|uniref:Fibrinogen C-terminal domain-containing protein n=3 Tax=Nematostella vectensis TaxID=45351 RepID=A7SVC0_NEMVE|nr:predicted protein [Nematostella vectensis]|eukprot:XP_001624435.1 predicted protein [Nematostella vectensis]